MKEYVTKSGDMWDLIAFREMGDSKHIDKLMNANRAEIQNFIFSAGVKLKIPDVDNKIKIPLPAWRL